jgi:hypothetical protein
MEIKGKDYFKQVDDEMLEITTKCCDICHLKDIKTIEEMYDRCQDIMNFSGDLLMDQIRVTNILQKLENNHAKILLNKEIPTNNTLVKALSDGVEGMDFSGEKGGRSLSAKTPQRKKLFRDVDDDICQSNETMTNVKATLEFIKNRVDYCKYIWSAYDRAVSLGFK